ncbi:gamma carbonic anhydrase family protein [Rhodocista pekingensis]|uniref:Gamma carbonic anhydrase family protein n=1 Tax=Rhodocista pekingensis TaxID=201185 RepID=A0ABW2KSE5_9PROT
MTPTILPFKGILPRIHPSAFLANATIIGDVEIAEDANIWFGVTIRGDVNPIRIGRRTNIQDGTVIHCTGGLTSTIIGDDVTVGHLALLHGCTIESWAFIGMKACVMDQVTVEGGAMVAAGALVTPGRTVRAGEVWGGSPAKFLRPIAEKDLMVHRHTIPHYLALARQYREEVGGTLDGTTAPGQAAAD